MNRQERRKHQREVQKNKKNIIKLTPEQTKLVDRVSNEKAKAMVDQAYEILFTCIAYACIAEAIDSETADRIIRNTSLMIDKNNIKEVEKEIDKMLQGRKDIMEFFNTIEGKSRKEAIAEAVYKFPSLAKSSISRYYDEWKKQQVSEEVEEEDPDIAEAIEKVSDIIDMGMEKESEKVLKESDKVAEDAENGTVAEELVCTRESCSIVTKEEKELQPKNDTSEYPVKPSLLKVKEMQVTLTSGDNTYQLSKEKILMNINGQKAQITKEEDYMEYVNGITEYYNRLLDEAAEAFQMWLTQCKKAV